MLVHVYLYQYNKFKIIGVVSMSSIPILKMGNYLMTKYAPQTEHIISFKSSPY